MKVWNAQCKCIWAWLYDNDQKEYKVSSECLFGIWHGYMTMTIQDVRKLSMLIWILAWSYDNDHTGYKQVEHVYLDFGMVI